MALFVQRDEELSELQKKIQDELRDKARKKSAEFDDIKTKVVDGVDDSGYMEGTEQSSSLLGLWVVLLAIGVVALIYFVVVTAG